MKRIDLQFDKAYAVSAQQAVKCIMQANGICYEDIEKIEAHELPGLPLVWQVYAYRTELSDPEPSALIGA